MKNPEKIALVGVGAIGGVVAAALADLDRHSLILCVRSGFDQLVVRHPQGTSRVEAPVFCDPVEARNWLRDEAAVDWILLATKAQQSDGARPWFEALCGPDTKLAVLQNGVDHKQRIAPLVAPVLAAESVLPVVVQLPAEKISAGRVEQSNPGLLLVPDDALGHAFAGLFEGARLAVRPVADFATQAWWKLVLNAALGGVCALAIRDNSAARDPELRNLLLSLMREVAEVGRAEGANLPEDAPEKLLERMAQGDSGHWSSITVDRREKRPMEWRVRNEVVGRYGRLHGIETPLNDAITALLRAADVSPVAGD